MEKGLREIGQEYVDVPQAFYKVVFRNTDGAEAVQVISFLIPNQASNLPLGDFIVTVNELEERTNLDFFAQKSEEWQNEIEAKVNAAAWKL